MSANLENLSQTPPPAAQCRVCDKRLRANSAVEYRRLPDVEGVERGFLTERVVLGWYKQRGYFGLFCSKDCALRHAVRLTRREGDAAGVRHLSVEYRDMAERITELEAQLARVRAWREEWGPAGYDELDAILDDKENP